MNQEYEQLFRDCQNLEFKVRDLLDDRSNPIGQQLISQTKDLTSDIRAQKNPRSVEDRVKRIINTFDSAQEHGDSIMDYNHMAFFVQSYERVIEKLRKFSNY